MSEPLTADTITDVERKIAAIAPQLPNDPHLADCDLARASGLHATLACAECGRAKWMHGTRHDTCAEFRWMTAAQLTDDLCIAFQHIEGLTLHQRTVCAAAMNHFGALPRGVVRNARRAIAEFIHTACARVYSAARLAEIINARASK